MDTKSHYRIDSGEVSVLVGVSRGTAEILHWGINVGEVSEEQSAALFGPHVAHNDSDISGPFGLWRENSRGHLGRPTAQIHRSEEQAWYLPSATSFKISLSTIRLATARLRRAFSTPNSLNRFASSTFTLPNPMIAMPGTSLSKVL